MISTRALLVFALFGIARPALAWDAGGHETIDAITWSRLNPKAQQAVTDAARAMSIAGRTYDATTLGTWMDDLRKNDIPLPQHGLFFTWHYIDIGIEPGDPVPSFQPGTDNEYNGNVVQALKRAQVVLAGGTDPYIKTQAMACALAMHLVGDIHQPLHAATHYFYSGGWRHHDAGGNKEYVVNGPGGDSHFNLHHFWDAAYRASFDEASGQVVLDSQYDDNPAAAQALAPMLAAPPDLDTATDFEKWAEESHRIAQDFVYREITATESKKDCRLSSGYVSRANVIARQRLVAAAYRLAALLNETLGADTPPAPPASYPAGPSGQPYNRGN